MAQEGALPSRAWASPICSPYPGHARFIATLASDAVSRPACPCQPARRRYDGGGDQSGAGPSRGRYYHLLASYDDGEVSRFGPGAAHLHDLMQLRHRTEAAACSISPSATKATSATHSGYRACALRPYRRPSPARCPGGAAPVTAAAAAQALDQADAVLVDPGLQQDARHIRIGAARL